MSIFWQDNSNSNQQSNYNRQSNYNGGDYEFVERKFDKDTLNNYFDNADYYGAANYLESITTKDVQSRIELNKRIRELRRMAEQEEGVINTIRDEYKHVSKFGNVNDAILSYNFLNRLKRGASMDVNDPNMDYYSRNNKYIKNYNNINKLIITDNGNNYIPDKLQIYASNEAIKAFKNALEKEGRTFENLGIIKGKNNSLTIDLNNYDLDLILETLELTDTEIANEENDGLFHNATGHMVTLAETLLPDIINKTFTNEDTKKINNDDDAFSDSSSFYSYDLYLYNTNKDKRQRLVGDNYKNFDTALSSLSYAKLYEQGINKILEKGTNKIEETYVSQFLGAGHIQAYNMLKNGKIDIDDYNKIVKERQETYDRLIQQTDLTQYKVYATDVASDNAFENAIDSKFGPGIYATMMDTKKRDETSMHELNNYDRRDLTKDLLVAIKDKRVTYSAAMVGGEIGTYITITPDIDENTGRPKEGSSAKYRRIFVPHLFESSCEEALNADTRSMAVRDLSNIGRYNYTKTLSDGSSLEYDENGNLTLYTPYVTSKEDNSRQRIISKDEALLLLDRDNAIDQSVDAILAKLGDSYNKKDADTLAQYAAEAIVNNLYKNINRGDRELEISRVYTNILKGLKIK